jgi:putative flippase GtrA
MVKHPMEPIFKLLRFAAVSGAGLAIDFGLFLWLVQLGTRPGIANAVSAAAAVTFVYFVAVRRIFSYSGTFLLPLFAAYLAYQLVGVAAASAAVDWLAANYMPAAAAKLAILPVTFCANYLFMAFLTRGAPGGAAPLEERS